MDSEKVIIELIKPLLKDYLAYTRGQVPNDWVNVRDERKRDIARGKRDLEDLNKRRDYAIQYNECAQKKLLEYRELSEIGYEDIQEKIKENTEEIEAYPERLRYIKNVLAQAEYELVQAEEQIETRRQAQIAKIKQKIHDRVQQDLRVRGHIKENQIGLRKDQAKVDGLKKYEHISDEEIEKLACILEKKEQKTAKIEEIKRNLEEKEEKYKDLLTEDYYSVREEYIKQLQEAEIEKIEKIEETIKLVSIKTIYKKAYKNALEQKDQTKAEEIIETMQKIEDRRQETIQESTLDSKAEYATSNEVSSKKEKGFIKNNQLIKGITKLATKTGRKESVKSAKDMLHNLGTYIKNKMLGVKLLGDGNNRALISEEQMNETIRKNKEKREQQVIDIITNRQSKKEGQIDFVLPQVLISEEEIQGRVIRSSEEEMKKQLEKDKSSSTDLDGLMKVAQDVVVTVNQKQIERYRAYQERKVAKVDVAKGTKTIEQSQIQDDSVPIKQVAKRVNDSFIIPEILKKDGEYKETLKAGISPEKQKEHVRKFFQKKKATKGKEEPDVQADFNQVSFE